MRKARGWRQLDIAEQAGVNENHVSYSELGRRESDSKLSRAWREPSASSLKSFCVVLSKGIPKNLSLWAGGSLLSGPQSLPI